MTEAKCIHVTTLGPNLLPAVVTVYRVVVSCCFGPRLVFKSTSEQLLHGTTSF